MQLALRICMGTSLTRILQVEPARTLCSSEGPVLPSSSARRMPGANCTRFIAVSPSHTAAPFLLGPAASSLGAMGAFASFCARPLSVALSGAQMLHANACGSFEWLRNTVKSQSARLRSHSLKRSNLIAGLKISFSLLRFQIPLKFDEKFQP